MPRVNIRGYKLSYLRYKHNKGAKAYFQFIRLNRLTYGILAVFSGLIFGTIFNLSNNLTEAQIMQPIQHLQAKQTLALASTDNKEGSTSPPSEEIENDSLVNKNNFNIRSLNSTSVIPPKPEWVNYPLFVDPNNSAAQYLATITGSADAKYIARMAQTPVAQWFGDWNNNVTSDVASYTSNASRAGNIPVVVVYSIPNRDCGGYSVGGANGVDNYIQWVQKLTNGIGSRRAVVVLEPDSLGALDCLPVSSQQDRLTALAGAVEVLKQNPSTWVYIDAGTPVWQPADVMAERLIKANIEKADGFSLNVSYFATTASNYAYGDKLSKLVGNKHYVIDTSRNGGNNKVTGMQCNPSFASFGESPTTNTQKPLADALLWIKIPWESDGPCNGSPNPGVSYWQYALNLAKNANW